jgi:hypothetical protein
MKQILKLAILLSCVVGFSQTYYFNAKIESIEYTDSNNQIKTKKLSKEVESFKIIFGSNSEGEEYYTAYKNNKELYWCYRLGSKGFKEFNNKIYELTTYFNTSKNSQFTLYFSEEKKRFIERYNSEIIEYN